MTITPEVTAKLESLSSDDYKMVVMLIDRLADKPSSILRMAREKYTKENGKEPAIDIIAKELGVEREDIAFSFDAIQDPVSLQEPVYNDGAENIYIMDQVKDSKNTDESWIESMTIKQIMKKLNDKEKMIITKRFFDGRTQMEVADEIGISQAQV